MLQSSYIDGNIEYIDRVDVRHSESASGMTGSEGGAGQLRVFYFFVNVREFSY